MYCFKSKAYAKRAFVSIINDMCGQGTLAADAGVNSGDTFAGSSGQRPNH
jgi:hypothetical protein